MMMISSLKLHSLGMYLDHRYGAIAPSAHRVMAVYPTLLGIQASKDVFQSKDAEERKRRLKDDTIRMVPPTVATAIATHYLMQPDAEAFNTTQAGVKYFEKTKKPVFNQGQGIARQQYEGLKAFKLPLWGRLKPDEKLKSDSALEAFRNVEDGSHPLDVQVGGVIQAIRKNNEARLSAPPTEALYNEAKTRLDTLHEASKNAVVEHALTATDEAGKPLVPQAVLNQMKQPVEHSSAYKHLHQWVEAMPSCDERCQMSQALPQYQLPLRIQDDKAHLTQLEADKAPLSKRLHTVSEQLMKHEIRLALPTNEDLSNFKGAFEGGTFSLPDFKRAMRRTSREFVSEAAVPFLGVGAASVGAGMVAGWMANKVEHRRPEKNADVMKEGVFQYVANIAMCGFGAGLGLGVSNAMGFTKFRNPVARLGSIVGGLGVGIVAGANLANPLSNFMEESIERKTHKGKPAPAHISGRKLELSDGLLHVDDVPTAFSVAGVQALKPWLPPFFLMSGIKTAYGYRNVEPVAHISPIPVGKRMPLQLFDATPQQPLKPNEDESALKKATSKDSQIYSHA
jgi:hypothetical protein